MANNQKIYNYLLDAFVAESKEQGDGSQRQVVEIGSVASGTFSPTVTLTHTRPTLTDATSSVVLALNASRAGGTILANNTAFPMFINVGAAAVMNQGIPLGPGVTLTLDTTQAINGIQSSGGNIEIDVFEAT